jgi:predicted metal-dependent peptidase
MNLVERTVINLLRQNKIFYASLLGQMRRVEVDKYTLNTCGVAVQNGRMYLYWNAAFLESLTEPERIAVLVHECMHLVFFHPFRRKDRDHVLFNIAGDIAINQMIENLPKLALLPSSFGKLNLPINASAEVYYDLLNKEKSKYSITKNPDGSLTIKRPDGTEITVVPVDSHEKWDDSEGGSGLDSLDAEVIKQAVKEAWDQTTNKGDLPANIVQAINDMMFPPSIPWQRQLKQYIGNKVKGERKYTWKRINKRFNVEDFKGRATTRMLRLVTGIDTSGSMSESQFQEIIGELRGVQQAYKSDFTMIEIDAKIQKVYKLPRYGRIDTNFKGRGGTDFRPFFEYIKEHGIQPDVCLYFTDLMGTFPDNPPPYHVLWIKTSNDFNEKTPVPFGSVLTINPHGKTKRRAS